MPPIGRFKPPTPGELGVLFVLLLVGLFVVGGLLLYLSFGQPPDRQEAATTARWLGGGLILLGMLLVALRRRVG
ncbi:MAG: hypothetical protein RBS80_03915 [Thermoguttaceae bacterium]|jgi:multisubunit Na+/H+ antiporter MnhG subunit|nr:hypothetical protein [Thermoguttaceae bacterium]